MHVVHYIQHLREEEGGVVRSVRDLSHALASHGCRVTVLTSDEGTHPMPLADEECGPHTEIIDLPKSLFGRLSPKAEDLVESLLRHADVLHLHTFWDPCNLKIAAIARRLGIPYIISTHGMLDDFAYNYKRLRKQIYLAAAGKRFARNAYQLHCTAEGEKRQVLSRVPGAEVRVIPLAFDITHYQQLPGPQLAESTFDCFQKSGPKLLFLARLNAIKGPDLLIEAIAKLSATLDLHVVLAGPADEIYLAELQLLADELQVADRLSFIGMVDGDLKLSLYQACDLFVLPTEQENFGMVFPEALACELPVLTTDRIDTAVELQAGGATLVPRTAEAFAEAIGRLLADRPALQKSGQQGRTYVLDWLNATKVAKRYNALYHDAAASKQN